MWYIRKEVKKSYRANLVSRMRNRWMAMRRWLRCNTAKPNECGAWNCRGLGSTLVVRILTDEVRTRNPLLVFLAETKASASQIKGIQTKLNFTQGIVVPSDGRSGSLALLWKEGTDVTFKSCSNTHIDVVVRESSTSIPWRATGFYGQPETEKRYI
ncbi:hypothetical protein ACB092_10G064800 [Castanea dentata]